MQSAKIIKKADFSEKAHLFLSLDRNRTLICDRGIRPIKIWDAATQSYASTIGFDKKETGCDFFSKPKACALHPNGNVIFYNLSDSGNNGIFFEYDPQHNKFVRHSPAFEAGLTILIDKMYVLPDGRYACLDSCVKKLYIINPENKTFNPHELVISNINDFTVLGNGHLALHMFNEIRTWDPTPPGFKKFNTIHALKETEKLVSLSPSNKDKNLFAAACEDGSVMLFDASKTALVHRFMAITSAVAGAPLPSNEKFTSDAMLSRCDFLPGDNLICMVSRDKLIQRTGDAGDWCNACRDTLSYSCVLANTIVIIDGKTQKPIYLENFLNGHDIRKVRLSILNSGEFILCPSNKVYAHPLVHSPAKITAFQDNVRNEKKSDPVEEKHDVTIMDELITKEKYKVEIDFSCKAETDTSGCDDIVYSFCVAITNKLTRKFFIEIDSDIESAIQFALRELLKDAGLPDKNIIHDVGLTDQTMTAWDKLKETIEISKKGRIQFRNDNGQLVAVAKYTTLHGEEISSCRKEGKTFSEVLVESINALIELINPKVTPLARYSTFKRKLDGTQDKPARSYSPGPAV